MMRCLLVLGLAVFASADNFALVNIATFNKTQPQTVSGIVNFTETSAGVLISGNISGLAEGEHGFHIHVYGDLSDGCTSTGGHFNPKNVSHGAKDAEVRHVGDLGNIIADKDGNAVFTFNDSIIALHGENNIIGRAVVVHSDKDDLGLGNESDSKTTGHAGLRVGCGVIGTKNDVNSGVVSHLLPTSAFVSLLGVVILAFLNRVAA